MEGWLNAFRGALLTWIALPVTAAFFAVLAIAWAVSASYHPLAPVAFQLPFLIAVLVATLAALIWLCIRHASVARRGQVWRNLAELGGLALIFVAGCGLIVGFIKGPKTTPTVLFGETYTVPTQYRPGGWRDETGAVTSLVIEVCGPDDAPIYSAPDCRSQALVRYGKDDFLAEFSPGLRLKEAGASHTGDTLQDPGLHQAGDELGEIIYRDVKSELRLWLDESQTVVGLRICNLAYRVDCTAMVRVGDRSMIFPVHDMATTESLPAMVAAANLWVARIEGWRCTGTSCPAP